MRFSIGGWSEVWLTLVWFGLVWFGLVMGLGCALFEHILIFPLPCDIINFGFEDEVRIMEYEFFFCLF